MERVLKRVGLSRRSLDEGDDSGVKERRRRRSKSRRRHPQQQPAATAAAASSQVPPKKTRGLFNIDWDSVRDCKACKSRALTKRFCSRKCDNELYRSNSFKFERFVRGGGDGDASTLGKKIALCEDYSLPLDHVNKRRPNSIAVPSTSDWNISSPNDDKVEVLETYSTPRDSKQQLSQEEDAEQKCFTSPDREYSQPYTTDASSGPSSDEEFFGHNNIPVSSSNPPQIELNSPDSIAEAILPVVQSPVRQDIKRHPSPYYYSDLFNKPSTSQRNNNSQTIISTKSECHPARSRLDATDRQILFQTCIADKASARKHNQKPSWSGYHKRYRKSGTGSSAATNACVASGEDVVDADMSRQRHVYETAFDCRVSKSDDDLDQIDKVSNHSVLSQLNQPVRLNRAHANDDRVSISALSAKLGKMHLPSTEGGYTPSPPSTAPLPTKFHGKELIMNSIRSAPNLPSHSSSKAASKARLAVKSLPSSSAPEKVLEIKDRPRKDLLLFKRDGKGTILEFKGRRRRHKYSSTESMTTTTSSSGGSMESIKSSTSEGRSTTSTESRNSSSLSSHDSDSGAASNYLAAGGYHAGAQTNKLHILSPISDKSSQEPGSEMSDNNRNNNSQKCSPEEVVVVVVGETTKSRRRLPQNKNLLNLGVRDPDVQGSDSGISIQSREGVKSRFGLPDVSGGPSSQPDFADLPFDMPKLRRRRLAAAAAAQDAACTSSSATSIDFGDLPFDMPKLRRRLRVQQTSKELSVSQASSSQSVVEPDAQGLSFKPKLSLNLTDTGGGAKFQKPSGLGLSLKGINSAAKSPTITQELIDVHLPLEKQGWYHGAVTRVEAENILRLLREGSFLVRNSESTKQDYSLSLKSARGFMHMRIQRDDTINGTRSFILGQFSKPFGSIPDMIKHFSMNGLPIRGAEHMCLIQPVIVQLL